MSLSKTHKSLLSTGASPRGGGGGVLWYFHTYVGSGYFSGFKILNFNIFWGFSEKKNWVWRICGYFLGQHKIGLYLVVISMHLGSFLKVKVQNRGYCFGLPKFQIFFGGAWNSWYCFGVNGRCMVRAYVCRKKWGTPPPPLGVQPRMTRPEKLLTGTYQRPIYTGLIEYLQDAFVISFKRFWTNKGS